MWGGVTVLTCRQTHRRRAEYGAVDRRQRCAGVRYAPVNPIRERFPRRHHYHQHHLRPVRCAHHARPTKEKERVRESVRGGGNDKKCELTSIRLLLTDPMTMTVTMTMTTQTKAKGKR